MVQREVQDIWQIICIIQSLELSLSVAKSCAGAYPLEIAD